MADTAPDPYRWLEEDSRRTRSWLRSQRHLLERRAEHSGEHAWESLLAGIGDATAGRPLDPPAEAGGMLFQHVMTASGSRALTVSDTQGRTRTLLDTAGGSSDVRIASWQPDPTGRTVVVQLHHDGRENGGLTLVPVDGDTQHLAEAAPHPAVAFLQDLLLYSAGTRTEHVLCARHLDGGPPRTLELPVPAPVRLSLHTTPQGHLLLRTRTPGAPSPRWWCARWDGRSPVEWQPLPLDGSNVTAFALGEDTLHLAVDGQLSALDLSAPERGLTAGAPAPSGTGTEIRGLRVLGPAGAPYLMALKQDGTVRHLDVRSLYGDAESTSFTWHARLRLGSCTRRDDGGLGDALWILGDDPVHGRWVRRVVAGAPVDAAPADRSSLRVLTATSRDGTAVPVTVCDPYGLPAVPEAGPVPTLITVYGGFGVPLDPSWDPITAAWLTAGGRVAWVHARGGGEFGPQWAAAGRGSGKSDTVDDLCAAAQHLVAHGEARPGRLAALAASNGGLVLAGALVRAPAVFAAVACAAPLTDMARYDVDGLGPLWRAEYGDPADPDTLRALLTYSPYHRVREGEPYPATLLITGGQDARVPPWHAWKLCAALQRATSGPAPILLDHQENSGHQGRSGSAARQLGSRVLAFLAARTGLSPSPSEPPPRSTA
ncbi:prolyl oligopeptidase family serine peptidase [Streptomyces acidiscabies]|uniref:prolyl oligopeptidase family serine peptidase n=1 Tax=Streptomyces acidiscabies TaxID=42234 RepID=UPI0030CFEBCE